MNFLGLLNISPFLHFSPTIEGIFHGWEGDWGVISHFPKIGKIPILAQKWAPARGKAFVFGHAPKWKNE